MYTDETDTPVETAVHHTVLHLGQPAGEDIALVDNATAPQGNEKVLGCMTRAEVVSLRENSVAIPAAIESEDGSLHTVFTRDWEEDDMGKIKITDASGVHYEIKPDPSCSTQIKHGRRLAVFTMEEAYSLTSGISVSCFDGSQKFDGARVIGTGNSDNLIGGAADDAIIGGAGDDRLIGEAGNDKLDGGPGNDVIHPGPGVNYIDGGDDVDKVVYPGQARGDYTYYHLSKDGIYYFAIEKNDGTAFDLLEDVERVQFDDYRCTINESQCVGGDQTTYCHPDQFDDDGTSAVVFTVLNTVYTCYDTSPEDIPGCFDCVPAV